jgi:hypothetical protein
MSATATAPKATEPAPTSSPKGEKYQVRYGTFWHGEEYDRITDPKDPRFPGTGRVIKPGVPYGPGRPAGDVVETNQDLTKLNDRRHPNGPRFVKLGSQDNRVEAELTAQLHQKTEAHARLMLSTKNLLSRMSARELIEYAEGEEIDLKGETRKDAVLRIVLDEKGLG